MRAAIYWRYSKEEQSEYSDAAQVRACSSLARERGWNVVNIYGDPGRSAKNIDGRPGFKQMLQGAEQRAFDVVIVHKLDRFSRNLVDTFNALTRLADNNVSFVSVTESQFDFTTPQGKLFLGMVALISQWYVDNLSQETAKGKRERAMQGGWNGALPFGYTTPKKLRERASAGELDAEAVAEYLESISFERETDAIIDPHDIEGYLMAVGMCEQGYTDWEIAMELNRKGYRVKSHWGTRPFGKDTIRGILNNRFYTGYTQYKGEWFPGKHEAAITPERWDSMQRVRRMHRKSNAGSKRTDEVYPLRRLIRCRKCNGVFMRGSRGSGHRYYRCPAKQYGFQCEEKMIRASVIESQVRDWLADISMPEDWRSKVLEAVQKRGANPDPDKEERERLERALARARNLYMWGDIDEKTYRSQKATVEAALGELRPPLPSFLNLEKAAEMLNDFARLWDEAPGKERQRLAQAMLDVVWVENGEVVSIVPKPVVRRLIEAIG